MAALDDLPNEVLIQILGYMAGRKEGCPLAPFATVCWRWQQVVESFLFTEVTFYLTNASIPSGGITPHTLANTIHGSRLRWLKTLRVIIDFDPSSFTTIIDAPRRRAQLGADFVDVVDGFVDTLDGWKREALFDLEIHEERSCGQHLNHFGSDLVAGPRRCIDCVRSIRHVEYSCDRCRCCSYRGLLSYLCSAMSESGSLKEISYGYQERVIRNRAILYEDWDFLPSGVRCLTIRNLDESSDPREMMVASGLLKRCLPEISRQLETLHVSHYVDALFFLSLTSRSWQPWPRLRKLSMTFAALEFGGAIL